MQITLQNKHAVVGGATSGLGRSVAVQLAKCGAQLTLLSHNEVSLKEILKLLPTEHQQSHKYLVVDFENLEEFKKITSHYFSEIPVDILVNNTHGPKVGNALNKDSEDYQKAFDQLFQTVQHLTNLVLPAMIEQGFGRVINLTSSTVQEPIEFLVLSNTIRSAITTWGKSLATTVAKHGITINNILTGKFYTERLVSLMKNQAEEKGLPFEEVKEKFQSAIPANRIAGPEEMGYLLAFLASDYASYITGTNLVIDGGEMKSL